VKYCKFKSVDISRCINNGITPKRGNPNEKNEEDELEKEMKIMANEVTHVDNRVDEPTYIEQLREQANCKIIFLFLISNEI